jgi:hypothetical protein
MRHFYIYQSQWAVIQMINLRVIPDYKDRREILLQISVNMISLEIPSSF